MNVYPTPTGLPGVRCKRLLGQDGPPSRACPVPVLPHPRTPPRAHPPTPGHHAGGDHSCQGGSGRGWGHAGRGADVGGASAIRGWGALGHAGAGGDGRSLSWGWCPRGAHGTSMPWLPQRGRGRFLLPHHTGRRGHEGLVAQSPWPPQRARHRTASVGGVAQARVTGAVPRRHLLSLVLRCSACRWGQTPRAARDVH